MGPSADFSAVQRCKNPVKLATTYFKFIVYFFSAYGFEDLMILLNFVGHPQFFFSFSRSGKK